MAKRRRGTRADFDKNICGTSLRELLGNLVLDSRENPWFWWLAYYDSIASETNSNLL